MNEEQNDLIFDLLTKKAVYGLDETEQTQLDSVAPDTADVEYRSLEMTVAAISTIGLSVDEPLPAHLLQKISADAETYVGADSATAKTPWPPQYADSTIEEQHPSRSWLGLLGWAVAAAACIALAVNIGLTRYQPVEQTKVAVPVETPQVLTPVQKRDEMLRSTAGIIKATWGAGNVKEFTDISGDVVWSNEKQAGYLRIRGLPANDGSKTTYQLWIFDKTRDPKHPVDGGTFDVSADGEVVIPINAKLITEKPEMFAVTIEKPGGVVVSSQEKIAALAKVEIQSS